MSSSYSNSEEGATASSENLIIAHHHQTYSNTLNSLFVPISTSLDLHADLQPKSNKRKRCQPGNPDPEAEVIALSPKSLMATNRFICEICNKGFQRDQNLQLHRRGHNLPWKLKTKGSKESIKKRVYVCPETSCVHHQASRALGDLTGIKKHFSRKHGEKKWRCDLCSKLYAVHSDWKAHVKTCGTREYRCDCGILFARKDSFTTHRAFCDALAQESGRLFSANNPNAMINNPNYHPPSSIPSASLPWAPQKLNPNFHMIKTEQQPVPSSSSHLSATALLQKACIMGPTTSSPICHVSCSSGLDGVDLSTWQKDSNKLSTRDFLGVAIAENEEEEFKSFKAQFGMEMVTTDLGGEHPEPFSGFGFGLPSEDDCPSFL